MTKFKLDKNVSYQVERALSQKDGQIVLSYSKRQPAWFAEVTGLDPKYILARKFIEADEEGGIWKAWDLEDNKIYCFKESREQYYFAIKDGMVTEYTRKQVAEMF